MSKIRKDKFPPIVEAKAWLTDSEARGILKRGDARAEVEFIIGFIPLAEDAASGFANRVLQSNRWDELRAAAMVASWELFHKLRSAPNTVDNIPAYVRERMVMRMKAWRRKQLDYFAMRAIVMFSQLAEESRLPGSDESDEEVICRQAIDQLASGRPDDWVDEIEEIFEAAGDDPVKQNVAAAALADIDTPRPVADIAAEVGLSESATAKILGDIEVAHDERTGNQSAKRRRGRSNPHTPTTAA